jgi:hypothetical protein
MNQYTQYMQYTAVISTKVPAYAVVCNSLNFVLPIRLPQCFLYSVTGQLSCHMTTARYSILHYQCRHVPVLIAVRKSYIICEPVDAKMTFLLHHHLKTTNSCFKHLHLQLWHYNHCIWCGENSATNVLHFYVL